MCTNPLQLRESAYKYAYCHREVSSRGHKIYKLVVETPQYMNLPNATSNKITYNRREYLLVCYDNGSLEVDISL